MCHCIYPCIIFTLQFYTHQFVVGFNCSTSLQWSSKVLVPDTSPPNVDNQQLHWKLLLFNWKVLGGGFKYFVIFTLKIGEDFQFFRWVGQTPQRQNRTTSCLCPVSFGMFFLNKESLWHHRVGASWWTKLFGRIDEHGESLRGPSESHDGSMGGTVSLLAMYH